MADPLSITASIIAVVGAAEGITKTLAKFKSIRNAPDELLALINEVSDLNIILSNVQSYIIHNTQKPQISQEELQNISTLINRAKEKLLELDQLIQYQLVKPESIPDRLKVSRREWLRARGTIEKLRQSLRDIRLNIVTHMVVVNSSHQSRIGLTIDEIQIISGQLQTSQNCTSDRTSQQLDEHSRLLADILNSQSNMHGLLQLQSSFIEQARLLANPSSTTHHEHPSNSVVRIRAYTFQHQRSPCTPYCGCNCHNVQTFQSPALLHKAIGTLFVGYSGYPIRAFQKCNEAGCVSQTTFRAYVHYLFPSWFLLKALMITLMSVFLDEISVSLTVRRIIPAGSEIIRLARLDDVEGIKRLFSMGLASPNDSMESGQSVLFEALDLFNLETCKFILSAGGDPHLEDFTSGRGSPFHITWNAIFTESEEPSTLEALQELFPDKDGAIEERGFTRFHKIVLGITSASLEQEINVDVSDIDSTDLDGWTALMWAAQKGDFVAVDMLIKAGADVNKVNYYGSSAFLFALQSTDQNCSRALLEAGANAAAVDCKGMTSLHRAASYQNDRDIVKILIEADVKVNQKDIYGSSPLSYTAFHSNTILAEALLDYGADIDAIDNEGDTPLHDALFNHADDLLHLLLSRGASYTTIYSLGRSLLHVAAVCGSLKTLEILLDARLRGIDTELVTPQGKTALQLAQERIDKPEGFLEKFEELLIDIRTRNAEIATSGHLDENHRWWSSLPKRTRSACVQFSSCTILTSSWANNFLRHANGFNSRNSLKDDTRIYWALRTFTIGLLYASSGFWVAWAKHMICLVWEIISPRDVQEL